MAAKTEISGTNFLQISSDRLKKSTPALHAALI
jgi:hypothetical protein